MPKKKAAKIAPKLTEGEKDLLSQMQKGYQLETDSLGSNPVLRRLKDGEVIRPMSANASMKALQERKLIHAVKRARSAQHLGNLLDTVRANSSIFDEPNFRQRLKGNLVVDSLAAELKPPDQAQLQKDIEAVSASDPLVRKLVMWRHNYVAHRNWGLR